MIFDARTVSMPVSYTHLATVRQVASTLHYDFPATASVPTVRTLTMGHKMLNPATVSYTHLTEMIEDALDQEEIEEFDQLENSADRMEEIEECMIERYIPVSYTHLDVYKRQVIYFFDNIVYTNQFVQGYKKTITNRCF